MSFNFITAIDILGTFSFAVSGAFAAMEKKLDPLGVLIISFVTAIGGGTIRDMLLGDLPVAWLTNNTTAWVIAISAVAAVFFGSTLKKFDKLLFVFDAIGLGLFTMIGIQKGIQHGLSTGICIALGTITACFGGVIRDVLLNKVPLIFQKEIYASACIAGGLLFFIMRQLQLEENAAYTAAIIAIFIIRWLAVRFNWSLPLFYLRK
ncbi:MAG TPA: trimeric intracellular cation channel family protein [Chitinophagaceae bacterium]|nr:trimeric intracellular cation channel family protein [Chitinophagaceae bacterium]